MTMISNHTNNNVQLMRRRTHNAAAAAALSMQSCRYCWTATILLVSLLIIALNIVSSILVTFAHASSIDESSSYSSEWIIDHNAPLRDVMALETVLSQMGRGLGDVLQKRLTSVKGEKLQRLRNVSSGF